MDGISLSFAAYTRLSVFLCCRIQLPQQSTFFSIFRLFSYISLSRQVHSTKSVASSSAFLRRIFIRPTLRPLHQSVNLISSPIFSLLFCYFSHSEIFVIIIQTSPRHVAQQQLTRGLKLFFKYFSFAFTGRQMFIQTPLIPSQFLFLKLQQMRYLKDNSSLEKVSSILRMDDTRFHRSPYIICIDIIPHNATHFNRTSYIKPYPNTFLSLSPYWAHFFL